MKTLLLILIFCISPMVASTLHLSISANPSRINPILSTDSTSSQITQWIFNALVTYDKDANIIPELAKRYYFVDETTLIFELRDDVKWSDGEPFTAKDVLFTYETIISPKIFTPYSSGFMHVLHVKILAFLQNVFCKKEKNQGCVGFLPKKTKVNVALRALL